MFTGIIKERGTLVGRRLSPNGGHITVRCPNLAASPGDSVAVEGVCLTATPASAGLLSFDLSLETLALTTLGRLPEGRPVNLEASLRLGDALGGHLVQGHVDGLGEVRSLVPEGDGFRLVVRVPPELSPHLARKGSVAVNGVSLTVADREGDLVSIALIPYTYRETTLSLLAPGDPVNLEVDMISRYLANLLAEQMPKEAKSHVHLG